jgi:hypothetical protein
MRERNRHELRMIKHPLATPHEEENDEDDYQET